MPNNNNRIVMIVGVNSLERKFLEVIKDTCKRLKLEINTEYQSVSEFKNKRFEEKVCIIFLVSDLNVSILEAGNLITGHTMFSTNELSTPGKDNKPIRLLHIFPPVHIEVAFEIIILDNPFVKITKISSEDYASQIEDSIYQGFVLSLF